MASLLPHPTRLLLSATPYPPLPPSSLPPCLAKVGKPSRSKHSALPSGSLQFRALSKEDHGEWECIATNVVTSITASTHLTVIGTAAGRRVARVLGTVGVSPRQSTLSRSLHRAPEPSADSVREGTWGPFWEVFFVPSNPLTQR